MAPTEPHPFEAAVSREWPLTQWCDVSVLVAVSGGADSVGLLRALAALHRGDRRNLVVAHFNHQLRSEESDRDQEFVQALAGRLGFACQVGTCRPSSAATRSLSEVAARQERYRFLTALADQLGARYVATGHTADDQAETILHRVIRGTGIGGLSGIPRSRRLSQLTTLIRPLRDLRRRQVLSYLEHLGQPFTNDTTNTQLAFTRNRIRLDLIPQLERDFNPRVLGGALPTCVPRRPDASDHRSTGFRAAQLDSAGTERVPGRSRLYESGASRCFPVTGIADRHLEGARLAVTGDGTRTLAVFDRIRFPPANRPRECLNCPAESGANLSTGACN